MHRIFKTFFPLLLVALWFGCCTANLSKPTIEQVPGSTITWDPDMGHGEWEDCSVDIGNHACNFKFLDQHANNWELYDHYGDIIVLDFSTMWCGVCQIAASRVESIQTFYGTKEVTWVTILLQDIYGGPVNMGDAKTWADVWGIKTSPVLAGDDSIANPTVEGSFNVQALPTIVIIDRDMVIAYRTDGWNETHILTQLDEMLNPPID